MNWLFWIILAFIIFSIFIGGRKGFFKTAISMVFLILVLILASLLNPHLSKALRENTPIYESVRMRSESVMTSYLKKEGVPTEEQVGQEIPDDMQNEILESLPLPQTFKDNLINNNRIDVYEMLGVDKFIDYLASYVALCITNGIAFLLSFTLAIVIIKVALYAINILTSLPGISFLNSVGGMILGGAQAILWIWVFFIVVTVLCNTAFGKSLMSAIEGDVFLNFLYRKNVFLPVVMDIFGIK